MVRLKGTIGMGTTSPVRSWRRRSILTSQRWASRKNRNTLSRSQAGNQSPILTQSRGTMRRREGEAMTSVKEPQDKPPRKRRLRNDEPDPEWTYTPPPLSEQAERFIALWVEQHPPTSEQGFTVFMHVPILRQILFWLEQPGSGPTEEQRQRAGGHETNVHVASHADLLMFGAGKRAERERVFIEMVEGLALLSFAVGGIPRMPQLCEAHDAQAIASAYAAFKEAEQSHDGSRARRGES